MVSEQKDTDEGHTEDIQDVLYSSSTVWSGIKGNK